MIPHINTVDGITVILSNKPVHIAQTDKYYQDVVDAINDGNEEWEIQEIVDTIKRELENHCNKVSSNMEYANGQITYQGQPLHGYAVDKLIGLIHAKLDTVGLTNFLEKLQSNPSMQTREDLYAFLEHGRIPINDQGNFLVYKAVRNDYKDIYSGTFSNRIGDTCIMPRDSVDDRREQTCSRGLHVCSFDYLPMFSHANGHVMVCEVNPADVVSIPVDYNNTKMRVCKYFVVGEVENYYQEHKDVLGGTEVWDEEYEVLGLDEKWEPIGFFDDLENAIAEAESQDSWTAVKVLNSNGVLVFYKKASFLWRG